MPVSEGWSTLPTRSKGRRAVPVSNGMRSSHAAPSPDMILPPFPVPVPQLCCSTPPSQRFMHFSSLSPDRPNITSFRVSNGKSFEPNKHLLLRSSERGGGSTHALQMLPAAGPGRRHARCGHWKATPSAWAFLLVRVSLPRADGGAEGQSFRRWCAASRTDEGGAQRR